MYVTEKLELCGMQQSDLDHCLFIGEKVICVVYVDDLLFWSTEEDHIVSLAEALRLEGVDLEEEGDAAGFLGVKLEREQDTGRIRMTQTGLIDRVITALGLDEISVKMKTAPAERRPLIKDADGDPSSESFSYASIVGMMLYLSGHTCPDLVYAVNACARYTFCPRRTHEVALKRIGRYLKLTRNKGLILTPSTALNVNAYSDVDFAGLYGYEDISDPTCTMSRAGFIITVADCPVLWQSKLQTETALLTMEAETVAFVTCCRKLLPILDIVAQIRKAVGMQSDEKRKFHIRIHEYNAGALTFMSTKPLQCTHRSKQYAIKANWFREQILKRGIEVLKIDTKF